MCPLPPARAHYPRTNACWQLTAHDRHWWHRGGRWLLRWISFFHDHSTQDREKCIWTRTEVLVRGNRDEAVDAVDAFFDAKWKWRHISWTIPSQVFRARHWSGAIVMRIQILSTDTDQVRLQIVNERSEGAYDWGLNGRDVRQLLGSLETARFPVSIESRDQKYRKGKMG